MATAVELAVIEMQIVVREMNRRLGGIERRLGIEPAPVPARDRNRGVTPLEPREAPVMTRRAAEAVEPYEIAGEAGEAAPPEPVPEPEIAAPETAANTVAEPTGTEHVFTPSAQPAAENSDREIHVMPPKGPATPPPSATRVMEFLQSHVPAPKPESTLETTLGIEVTSWVAAFAIMGGILFFLKLAMDSGTVMMHPWVRVLLAGLAGAGMLAHGLWLQRRKMRVISAALMAAGIATLMGTVFAGNLAFAIPVFSRPVAFCLAPLVGLLGIGLALRQRWVAMALMAFAGMYLSPWVLQSTADHSRVVLTYLLLVTGCCIALAAIKRIWDHLRLLAFSAGWLSILAWASGDFAESNFGEGLLFINVFFLLYLGDMYFNLSSALRDDAAQELAESNRAEYWDLMGAIFSVVNTALAFSAVSLLFDKTHMTGLWVMALLLAGAMAAVSRSVGGRYFARSAEIQSLILLVIAVPMYFDGPNTTMAWMAMALAFGIYANARNSEQSRIFMFATLLLAAGRHFTLDIPGSSISATLFNLGSNAISAWMLMGWTIALLAIVLAWLSRPLAPQPREGPTRLVGAAWATIGCIALSTIMVLIVNIRALHPGDAFTLAAIVWAFALIALLRIRAMAEIDTALEALVTGLLLLLSLKWFVYDGIAREVSGLRPGIMPFWNAFTLAGILLALAILALNPMRKQPLAGRRLIAWWMTALLFAYLNMQAIWCIDHFVTTEISGVGGPELFKNASLTILWASFASVMIGLGFLRKSPSVRYVALVLLAFTVCKIILVDMANVDTILRVFSLIALGTLLFVVSYLYHAHIRELPRRAATEW